MPLNAWKSAAAAGALAALYRGVPLKPRRMGQSAEIQPQGCEDENWPHRADNGDKLELTQHPVRLSQPSTSSIDEAADDGRIVEEEVDVVVVGGAAAGLSSAACLAHEGLKVVVLEKNEQAGDIWRSRYHRLHLHDIAEECHLPHLPLPDSFPKYPSRQQFAQYLDAYWKCLGLDLRLLHVVESAEKDASGKWKVSVRNVTTRGKTLFTATHLVIANGIYNDPLIPALENASEYQGLQLHSSRYTNAKDLGLVNKKVLVVGWGNSGSEIAVDLVEHGAKPTLLARSPQVIVPRHVMQVAEEVIYTHLKPLGKIPFGWTLFLPIGAMLDIWAKFETRRTYKTDLSSLGFLPHWAGPLLNFIMNDAPPVMDVGTVQCAKDGKLKVINKGIKGMWKDGVVFEDGSQEAFDAVVFATGYNMFSGHQHFFSKDLAEKVGLGVSVLKDKWLLPGSEYPDVDNLWFIYGRLQFIRDSAPGMARKILAKTPGRPDLNPTPFTSTWTCFVLEHLIVLVSIAFVVANYV